MSNVEKQAKIVEEVYFFFEKDINNHNFLMFIIIKIYRNLQN